MVITQTPNVYHDIWYFKKGTINVGDRQKGRLEASSVINVKANRREITRGINILYNSKFQSRIKKTKNPYGNGGASQKIISILKKIKPNKIMMKKFYDI